MTNQTLFSALPRNHSPLRLRGAWCCEGLFLFLCFLPTFVLAEGPLDKLITLDIPANSRLEDALIQWGMVTGVTVLINTTTVADRDADGVHGTVVARDALVSLLRRADLTYKEEGGRISVVPKGSLLRSRLREGSEFSGTASDSTNLEDSSVPAASDTSSTNKRESSSLDQVIVTAQRRQERLIDTPIAVTALDADEMSKTGVKSIADFADSVPGMINNSLGSGINQISFRGVTTGSDVAPTAAMYIDDVALPSSGNTFANPDTAVFDLDRIEVLRGPQGTMYGVSSLGGLLKYVTKVPDLNNVTGVVQARAADIHEGGADYGGGGAVNIPLIQGVLGVRASIQGSHDGGYIDNVQLGRPEVNRGNSYGARLDTLFKPNDALSIRVAGMVQYLDRKGSPSADYAMTGQFVQGVGALGQIRYTPEPFSSQYRLVDATVSDDFGPAKLTSISAYQDFYFNFGQDVTGFTVPFLQCCFNYPPYNTYTALEGIVHTNYHKFTQEFRLESNGSGSLQWVLGSFYSHQGIPGSVSDAPAFTSAGQEIANPGVFQTVNKGRNDEVAGFGDVTVRVTHNFDLTGGLRYAKLGVTGFPDPTVGVFGNSVSPYVSATTHTVTYLGNARYHFGDDEMGYLRYATGYRPGAPNGTIIGFTGQVVSLPAVKSDSLKSYEAGYKAALLSGRLGIDIAGYHINWSDIQVSTYIDGYGVTVNAPGGASIWGSELAITGHPVQPLLLSGTFAYQDAHLRTAEPALGAFAGERLPNVPRVTGTLSADYIVAALAWQPTVGASVRYMDARWASFDQNAGYPQYHLPDYAVVDLRTGLHFGSLDLQGYVRNALNKLGQMSALTGNSAYSQVIIVQPRTIGLSLTKQF